MIKKLIAASVFAIALSGCTDAEGARKALDGAGYTDIQIKGYSMFSCGKDDTYATEFSAKGPTGKPVEGVVCKGMFKGSTIRTD